jgi:hypothetical protein
MPVYTLYLNTAQTNAYYKPIDTTSLANVTWNINWDDLFGGDSSKYSSCNVRLHLVSDAWVAGASDWSSYVGYIACSLSSGFQQQRGQNGTVLSMLYPKMGLNTITSSVTAYDVSTLDAKNGVQINIPRGSSPFTISFRQDNSTSSLISWSTDPQWSIFLSFELV